jgi:two-component system LytT family response regulator
MTTHPGIADSQTRSLREVGAESYALREEIGHISGRLDPTKFVRIHRSTIVNVQRIMRVEPVNSGEYIAVLKDSKQVWHS